MDAVYFSETQVSRYETTRLHIPNTAILWRDSLIGFVDFCRYLMGVWNVTKNVDCQYCACGQLGASLCPASTPPPLSTPWLLPTRFIEFNTEVACIITKFITQSCVTRQLKYLAATSLRFSSRRPWVTDVPCNLISFLHPVQFPSSDATEGPVGPQQG
jgi:hypothetical protein